METLVGTLCLRFDMSCLLMCHKLFLENLETWAKPFSIFESMTLGHLYHFDFILEGYIHSYSYYLRNYQSYLWSVMFQGCWKVTAKEYVWMYDNVQFLFRKAGFFSRHQNEFKKYPQRSNRNSQIGRLATKNDILRNYVIFYDKR